MSVYVVIDWLVPRGHEADTEQALAAVREHLVVAHPKIRSVRVLREVADQRSPLGFRWEERYDCLADSQGLVLNDECDDLWLKVWQVAVPGSHRQSVWDDGAPRRLQAL